MKISFDNSNSAQIEKANAAYSYASTREVTKLQGIIPITKSTDDSNTYEGSKMSVDEFKNYANAMDVSLNKDYLTVMSHSMSSKDFGKMLKNGDRPASIEAGDMVTVLDHIKVAVAKSGKQIEGFTDDISREAIKDITGQNIDAKDLASGAMPLDSRAVESLGKEPYFEALAVKAGEYDISVDKEIASEIKAAYEEIKDVTEMTDGMRKFFLQSGKRTTIDNMYLAKHSATYETKQQGSGYFTIEAYGYLAKKGDEMTDAMLEGEVSGLLKELDIPITAENLDAGKWLVKNTLCVNSENIQRLDALNTIKLPVSDENFAHIVAIALSEGKLPQNADVTATENIFEQAIRVTREISDVLGNDSVKAARVLGETYLKMTAEANLLLLESGYHIDTADMEAYVEKLKELETKPEFVEAKAIVETETVINNVKSMPAAVIGRVLPVMDRISLSEIAKEGESVKKSFDEVLGEYEKVGTTVRKDFGDSIKKAFRNVDDILGEIGLEATDSNRRAVRILGYNSMPINSENIDKVKDADGKLAKVLNRITPADTLKLIRKGSSPIKMSINELNEYLDEKENTEEEKIEQYAKFLYKLEKSNDITKEERKQFIDVYRLFHQLEVTDDAAVGSLVNAGMDLSFENLKTAVKTAKNRGLDVSVGEKYENLVSSSENDILETEWINEKFTEMKTLLDAPDEAVREIVNAGAKVTPENLQAVLGLKRHRGRAFSKAFEKGGESLKEKTLAVTGEMTDTEPAVDAYKDVTGECAHALYESALEQERYIDVRELQRLHLEMNVARSFADSESYEVPVEIGGKLTTVSLKLVHNLAEEPNAVIVLDDEYLGRVSARLTVSEGKIFGYIACSYKDSITDLKKVADKLGDGVNVVHSAKSDPYAKVSSIPLRDNVSTVSAADLYDASMKFIDAMKGI